MIWLAAHMWLLLLLAFLLGLLIGWWIWHRRPEARPAFVEPEEIRTPVAAAAPVAMNLQEEETDSVTLDELDKVVETAPVPQPVAELAPDPVAEPAASAGGIAPKLFDSPTEGPADDLKKISGIGPKYETLLNDIGVWYFTQIASWTDEEIDWLDNRLEFPGRIRRDKWQDQARALAAGESTDFAKRYDKGEVPSSFGLVGDMPSPEAKKEAKFNRYLEDVRKYDVTASEDIVRRIVNHLGVALQSRDASLVACSDQEERDQVCNGFCAKKLDMGYEEASAAVETVCQTMKADRNKSRVTFYYLLAKNAGKLDLV